MILKQIKKRLIKIKNLKILNIKVVISPSYVLLSVHKFNIGITDMTVLRYSHPGLVSTGPVAKNVFFLTYGRVRIDKNDLGK